LHEGLCLFSRTPRLSRRGAGCFLSSKGPLEITVLFPAGTSADVTARMLAEGMSKALGQRVLVVNRQGAGGAIGYRHVASQKADGYSLVWNSNSISTTYHSGLLPFDYQAFDAVARVLVESPVIAVRADSRWKSLNDLIVEAKQSPRSSASVTRHRQPHAYLARRAVLRGGCRSE